MSTRRAPEPQSRRGCHVWEPYDGAAHGNNGFTERCRVCGSMCARDSDQKIWLYDRSPRRTGRVEW